MLRSFRASLIFFVMVAVLGIILRVLMMAHCTFSEANAGTIAVTVSGSLIDCAIAGLALILFHLVRNRAIRGVAAALALAVPLLQVADYFYFRATLNRIDHTLLHHTNAVSVGVYLPDNLPIEPLMSLWLLGIAAACAFVAATFGLARLLRSRQRLRFAAALRLAVVTALLFPGGYWLWRSSVQYMRATLPPAYAWLAGFRLQATTVGKSAVVNLITAALPPTAAAQDLPTEVTAYEPKEAQWLADNGFIGRDASPVDARALPGLRRVILVLVESLARDYFPEFNPKMPQVVMPNLRHLARQYGMMSQFWTTQLPSYEGMHALFMSQPRLLVGDEPDGLAAHGLFGQLRRAGIKTSFTVGAPRGYGGMVKILDKFLGVQNIRTQEMLDPRYGRPYGWGYSDRAVLRDALDRLRMLRNERAFVVAELGDTHPPYIPRIDEADYAPDESLTPLLNALNWTDRCIKEFVDALEADGLLDDGTLLVITGDHTPNHGEYMEWTGAIDYQPGPVFFAMITKNRSWLEQLRRDEPASQLDFTPTILEAFGLPVPAWQWGRSLLDTQGIGRAITYHNEELFVRMSAQNYRILFPTTAMELPEMRVAKRALWKWGYNKQAVEPR